VTATRNTAGLSEEECKNIAERLEKEHPKWMVMFGVYSREFYCLPLFPDATPGLEIRAQYPEAAAERMQQTELEIARRNRVRVREGGAPWNS
jgi:hypothetical protein